MFIHSLELFFNLCSVGLEIPLWRHSIWWFFFLLKLGELTNAQSSYSHVCTYYLAKVSVQCALFHYNNLSLPFFRPKTCQKTGSILSYRSLYITLHSQFRSNVFSIRALTVVVGCASVCPCRQCSPWCPHSYCGTFSRNR